MVRPIRNDSSTSSSRSVAATPTSQKNKPAENSLDPNQMFILSGPFPTNDPNCGILISRPIPPGSTVIAKPILGSQPPPFTINQQQLRPINLKSFNPNAKPFVPNEHQEEGKTPMVMMWSMTHPEGKLVPLRQPAPPVYFQPLHQLR